MHSLTHCHWVHSSTHGLTSMGRLTLSWMVPTWATSTRTTMTASLTMHKSRMWYQHVTHIHAPLRTLGC